MTLRELIQSVDTEQYSDNTLFQKLRETKPEYGSSRHIVVKLLNGEVAVTNAHVGSLGDILTYPIDVAPDLQVTKIQLLDFIQLRIKELTAQVAWLNRQLFGRNSEKLPIIDPNYPDLFAGMLPENAQQIADAHDEAVVSTVRSPHT